MSGPLTPEQARLEGLRLAVDLWEDRLSTELIADVERTALTFARILTARPARLVLRPAPFTFAQGPPGPGIPTRFTGGTMSVTMTDAQAVTYAVEPEDSEGFQVADTITWSSDDAGAVLTVTPAEDGLSCAFAAVAPGTATITASDGTLSGSDLITVTTGAVAALVLTPGTPA
jgi:hypothetical protein